jgi:hypothetical protein
MEKGMTHKLTAVLLGFLWLRQAVERQSVLAGRAQLLVGRLGIQDQRVARWQAEVQKLEGETAVLSAETGDAAGRGTSRARHRARKIRRAERAARPDGAGAVATDAMSVRPGRSLR